MSSMDNSSQVREPLLLMHMLLTFKAMKQEGTNRDTSWEDFDKA